MTLYLNLFYNESLAINRKYISTIVVSADLQTTQDISVTDRRLNSFE